MCRAMMFALAVMPDLARADVLTFEISPDHSPDHEVSCRIELHGHEMNVLEVRGAGMPPAHPMRWTVRKAEELAVLRALQALVSGDLAGVDIYNARLPLAPYVTVTWSTRVSGVPTSGLYVQKGLDLPPVLAGLIDTVLPGGPCELAVQRVVE